MKNEIIEKLDKILNEYMDKGNVPGLAVGVVYNSETIYTKGFGVKNIETKEGINEYSLFHMASISKTFVATGIIQLVQQGKINLDSYLTRYLPYFELKDQRYKKITIRQMLNHISGMPDVEDYEWDKPEFDEEASERYVKSLKDNELMWEPGEKFAYSNMAFDILGDVISKVSGMSFENYMKENILNIIDMKESNFLKPLVSKELLTTPHVFDLKNGYKVSEIFPYNRIHSPSSTLCSNAVEMCNYAIANLNKGSFKSSKILEADAYSELWKKQADTGWYGYASSVGLSWFLGDYKGAKVRCHSGGDTGFRSNLVLFPEIGAAVVIMMNSDYASIHNMCNSLMDIVLGCEVKNIKASLAQHMLKIMTNNDAELAKKEYLNLKENSLDEYFINEGEFNSLAYTFLNQNRIKEAIEFLKISVNIFPESANLYDSLGEMCLADGDKKSAIENYKRSVELNPSNIRGKKVLENLINEDV